MAEIGNITVTIEFDSACASSSHLISMAEAALDLASPKWRSETAENRQAAKDDMMLALWRAAEENPVGKRAGIFRESPFRMKVVR